MKCWVSFPFFIIAAVIACRMIDLDIPTTHDATYFPSRSFDVFFFNIILWIRYPTPLSSS